METVPQPKSIQEMQAERLKLQQQQLQNQIDQERLKQLQQQNAAKAATPVAPALANRVENPALRNVLGNWNGRFWKLLSESERQAYLIGLADAASNIISIDTLKTREDYHAALAKYWPKPLTFAEIVTALDTFYVTPENATIPVVDALGVISKRASGSLEDEIQKSIQTLRGEIARIVVES